VFPLFSEVEVQPDYLTLAEALAQGYVRIEEVSLHGSVPELRVVNRSSRSVLLLDGDEVVGARQNRVLNTTVLVGPERELVIPVSCVEQGRWAYRANRGFTSENRMMFSRARAEKMAQVSRSMKTSGTRASDQSAVWEMIARKEAALGSDSETRAMSDSYRRVQNELAKYRARLHPLPRQVGAVFALDGEPVGLEVFDAPRTLHATFSRLVDSYAMDALEDAGTNPPTPKLDAVEGFIAKALGAHADVARAIGEGEDIRLETIGLAGQALVSNERLVHLSVLARASSKGSEGSTRGSGRAPRRVVA
jgi:hypothetical protein